MTRVFGKPTALLAAAGERLGPTDWLAIDQARINAFAAATGDHQWIHVDPERARSGPFGTTIAHGYLTLSLVNLFLPALLQVDNLDMGVNYGLGRVRFPNHVPVGSRIRAAGEIIAVEPVAGGVQVTTRVTVEREGSEKPVCIADTISRYLGA